MNAGVVISTSTNIMLLWDNMQQLFQHTALLMPVDGGSVLLRDLS